MLNRASPGVWICIPLCYTEATLYQLVFLKDRLGDTFKLSTRGHFTPRKSSNIQSIPSPATSQGLVKYLPTSYRVNSVGRERDGDTLKGDY